eukprot:scaffold34560_cov64-Phaeocystis_antarctica.AAC.4
MYVSPAGIKQKIERAIACPALPLMEIWAALMLGDELDDENDQDDENEPVQIRRTWSAYDALLTASSLLSVRAAQVLLPMGLFPADRTLARMATSGASYEDTSASPTAQRMRAPEQQTSSSHPVRVGPVRHLNLAATAGADLVPAGGCAHEQVGQRPHPSFDARSWRVSARGRENVIATEAALPVRRLAQDGGRHAHAAVVRVEQLWWHVGRAITQRRKHP